MFIYVLILQIQLIERGKITRNQQFTLACFILVYFKSVFKYNFVLPCDSTVIILCCYFNIDNDNVMSAEQ